MHPYVESTSQMWTPARTRGKKAPAKAAERYCPDTPESQAPSLSIQVPFKTFFQHGFTPPCWAGKRELSQLINCCQLYTTSFSRFFFTNSSPIPRVAHRVANAFSQPTSSSPCAPSLRWTTPHPKPPILRCTLSWLARWTVNRPRPGADRRPPSKSPSPASANTLAAWVSLSNHSRWLLHETQQPISSKSSSGPRSRRPPPRHADYCTTTLGSPTSPTSRQWFPATRHWTTCLREKSRTGSTTTWRGESKRRNG